MTTIREATYELLRQHGMTTMFGNPGSNELTFLNDFPEDFRYVMGLHEGSVLAMADGYAQVTGTAPLVSLHSAAGTGTSMGVLANTVVSKSPVVVLSGQQVRDMVGQEIMVASTEAAQLPKPLTKFSAEPLSPKDVVRTIAQAIHIANMHPKGPAHISVPYDDWDQPSDENTPLTVQRRVVDATALSEPQLAELAARIDAASSPVLVLGPEVDATHSNADAVRLAERLGAPAWIAPSPPRCPFPTTHPLFAGLLPPNVAGIAELLSGHDLVIVVGAPVFRYHHDRPGRYLAEGSSLVHISQDPAEIARAPFGDSFLAPVADTLARLAESVAPKENPVPVRAERTPGVDREDRMHPDTVFRAITELAPDDAVHVVESTSTADSFWGTVRMESQGSFYSAAAGGLGFGLPAAVGIQLANPRRRVVASIGDGSANFGITGLWSAAQQNTPVVFVILRNDTYGAMVNFNRRLKVTGTPSVDLPGIDFVQVAAGYGVPAELATTEAELRLALKRAFASDGPTLIEARTFHD
ncbi:benzoylformate decarboxylase [Salinibacterium sp. dk2585]|uniref:benzoylformate decarboxylase n=1 Tax=unclassified Salinibacterium TaxID=2632331 RepID=UPI0011C246C6|nr:MULTISPECIES: benzoylformate decarboxylase [unclassified Salinibacterium]QEE60388.1 benzoylformate decarboxylase [Salinibacterium sp. dk2585]TXK55461.1 benzoylformate decarboxylase [Salinibacterium sp. dk5596]